MGQGTGCIRPPRATASVLAAWKGALDGSKATATKPNRRLAQYRPRQATLGKMAGMVARGAEKVEGYAGELQMTQCCPPKRATAWQM